MYQEKRGWSISANSDNWWVWWAQGLGYPSLYYILRLPVTWQKPFQYDGKDKSLIRLNSKENERRGNKKE